LNQNQSENKILYFSDYTTNMCDITNGSYDTYPDMSPISFVDTSADYTTYEEHFSSGYIPDASSVGAQFEKDN